MFAWKVESFCSWCGSWVSNVIPKIHNTPDILWLSSQNLSSSTPWPAFASSLPPPFDASPAQDFMLLTVIINWCDGFEACFQLIPYRCCEQISSFQNLLHILIGDPFLIKISVEINMGLSECLFTRIFIKHTPGLTSFLERPMYCSVQMGLSETKIPLNPLGNHHDP